MILEVFCNEVRPVVGADSWARFQVEFPGALQDDLDVRLIIDSLRSQFMIQRLQPSGMLHKASSRHAPRTGEIVANARNLKR